MRTVSIGKERVRVGSSSERALLILDAHNGCAMTSKFASGSGRWVTRDKVEGGLGVEVCEYHLSVREGLRVALDKMPPWVRVEAEAHPRARTLVYVTPESYDRFDALVVALKGGR